MASIHDFRSGNSDQHGNNNNNNGGGPTNNVPPFSTGGFTQDPSPQPLEKPKELIDMIEKAQNGEYEPALFRDEEIQSLQESLSRKKKSNAFLIGDAGVGKTQIVEHLALLLAQKDPIATAIIGDKPIYELPLHSLVSGKSLVGQLEQTIEDIIDFVSQENAIVFIDEIHLLLDSDSTYTKIAQQLKPALARSAFKTIGATTTSESTTLLKDPAFKRRFASINVPELTLEQTHTIIEHVLPSYEKYYDVLVPDAHKDEIIDRIIAESENYKNAGNHRPDTALTLLDLALAKTKSRIIQTPKPNIPNATVNKFVTIQDIKKAAISQFQNKEITQNEVQELINNLNNNIIGQDNVKSEIINMAKRMSLRLKKQEKPKVIMFAGPTGTGKTEFAKEMALSFFGRKDAFIYINMTEYTDHASLTKLTGSTAGYIGSDNKNELPLESLNNNPFQIVLLDEFEKADLDVKRFFMQIFDNGKIRLNRMNQEIDCSKAIFIATTNAGALDFNKQSIGFGSTQQKSKTEISNILTSVFEPELLNRFTHKMIFESITLDDYMKILAIKYNKIIKEAEDLHPEWSFNPQSLDITNQNDMDLLKNLAKESYNPAENGRTAERTMESYVENYILNNQNQTQFTFF